MTSNMGEQGWRNGESSRLWCIVGFRSRCSRGFSPRPPVVFRTPPPPSTSHAPLITPDVAFFRTASVSCKRLQTHPTLPLSAFLLLLLTTWPVLLEESLRVLSQEVSEDAIKCKQNLTWFFHLKVFFRYTKEKRKHFAFYSRLPSHPLRTPAFHSFFSLLLLLFSWAPVPNPHPHLPHYSRYHVHV